MKKSNFVVVLESFQECLDYIPKHRKEVVYITPEVEKYINSLFCTCGSMMEMIKQHKMLVHNIDDNDYKENKQ